MISKKLIYIVLSLLYIVGGTLYAKEYDLTSYYVAYDKNDKKQFALVLPSVQKVYTHQAGHILPDDLKQVNTQFKSFPTYNNGELCFSALLESASGNDGASIMESNCYKVDFFYTQKQSINAGMTFILTYVPIDKVYEGLAGKADSFKVVRDGSVVKNENSITQADYTEFNFDPQHAAVLLPGNTHAIAINQYVLTDEDTARDIILEGYKGSEGSSLTYILTQEPLHGRLTLVEESINPITGKPETIESKIIYTPNVNYYGEDSFKFKVNDGDSSSSDATVFITVNSINDAPIIKKQTVETDENVNKEITIIATDVDGDKLTYRLTQDAIHGTLDLPVLGTTNPITGNFEITLLYIPNSNYNGEDRFELQVNDGTVNSPKSIVNITINPVNNAPVAVDQDVDTNGDRVTVISLDASDIDSDRLSYMLTENSQHGTLGDINDNGEVEYIPNPNYFGYDSFKYKVNDGSVDSSEAMVTIFVMACNNRNPITGKCEDTLNQSITIEKDSYKEIILLSGNVNGENLNYSITQEPLHGTLETVDFTNPITGENEGVDGNKIRYIPNTNYSGVDSFKFQVVDGGDNSSIYTIDINIIDSSSCQNIDPLTGKCEDTNNYNTLNQSIAVEKDTAKEITLLSSTIDSLTLNYSITREPLHGTLETVDFTNPITGENEGIDGNKVKYIPNSDYIGGDIFNFQVADGGDDLSVYTIDISVGGLNTCIDVNPITGECDD